MKGRKPVIAADPNAIDGITKPPSFLSKAAKGEWRRVMPDLTSRRILSAADLGCLENYCVATGRVRELERLIQAAKGDIDPVLFRMSDKSMQTARQLAAELGLTPVSRSRPSVRDDNKDDDDDNPLNVS